MKTLIIFAMISTSALSAQEKAEDIGKENLEEQDEGVLGISIQHAADGAVVVFVIPDSPAFVAGLEKDDLLTHVNGRALEGLKVEAQLSILRGGVGSEVNITVVRPNLKDELIVHLIRVSKQKLLKPRAVGLPDNSEIVIPKKAVPVPE